MTQKPRHSGDFYQKICCSVILRCPQVIAKKPITSEGILELINGDFLGLSVEAGVGQLLSQRGIYLSGNYNSDFDFPKISKSLPDNVVLSPRTMVRLVTRFGSGTN